jgi:hypothetical protein
MNTEGLCSRAGEVLKGFDLLIGMFALLLQPCDVTKGIPGLPILHVGTEVQDFNV